MDEDDEARVSLAKDDLPAGAGASAAGAEAGGRGESPLTAVVSGAAYAALALLGGVFGLVGSYAQQWTAGKVPVTSIVLVLLVYAMARLAGWGMGGKIGAAVPAVVWGVVVIVMSMQRAEGDLVVPGTLAGYVYIVGGMVAAGIAVARVPSPGPAGQWLTGRAARTRG
ncbi:DUF6113 family protein [Actinomadura verrucosospora]|uniref:Integral membrane protein n=1 Tax=Actinomadura verrucosospora TaxID=46165 RepID=A0A7D4API8_ACTVE|nr:DUF6113 family protein [Actinomadura verrucosospora]QKG21809.1 Integral membrane protein [Actinomadura verrucosospora]